jgi:putative ABC transport system substrate-binding protein
MQRSFFGAVLLCGAIAAGAPATAADPEKPAGSAAPPAAAAPRIVVLAAHDTGADLDVIAGFRLTAGDRMGRPAIELLPAYDDEAQMADALRKARRNPVSLVFAIGSAPTRVAIHEVPDLPIVAGMIPTARDLLGADNATGVVLEFPLETEFRWLLRFLPAAKRVGVLYNPQENSARIAQAQEAAAQLGLTLSARRVASALDVPDAMADLARSSDVLWGLPDPLVLNARTARPVLLVAMRERTPFVGSSFNWVKAGALYALDRDDTDIGAQCGEMAARILAGAPPTAIPPAPPRAVVYSINLKTARLLKIALPEALVRGAQTVVDR